MGEYRTSTNHMSVLDESAIDLLEEAGFRLNTVFPGFCNLEDIRRMGRAKYAVRSYDERNNKITCEMMCNNLGIELMRNPLPRGMRATETWLTEVSELTGRDLSSVSTKMRDEYKRQLSVIRSKTEGKTAIVVTRPSSDYSWLFEILEDLGIRELKSRQTTFNRWLMGQYACDDKTPYTSDLTSADTEELSPDIVLSDSQMDVGLRTRHWRILTPSPGLKGIIDWAERLGRALYAPEMEAWR